MSGADDTDPFARRSKTNASPLEAPHEIILVSNVPSETNKPTEPIILLGNCNTSIPEKQILPIPPKLSDKKHATRSTNPTLVESLNTRKQNFLLRGSSDVLNKGSETNKIPQNPHYKQQFLKF